MPARNGTSGYSLDHDQIPCDRVGFPRNHTTRSYEMSVAVVASITYCEVVTGSSPLATPTRPSTSYIARPGQSASARRLTAWAGPRSHSAGTEEQGRRRAGARLRRWSVPSTRSPHVVRCESVQEVRDRCEHNQCCDAQHDSNTPLRRYPCHPQHPTQLMLGDSVSVVMSSSDPDTIFQDGDGDGFGLDARIAPLRPHPGQENMSMSSMNLRPFPGSV